MLSTFARSPGSRPPRSRRRPRPNRVAVVAAAVCVLSLFSVSNAAAAEAPVGLGTASSFAVLAGAGITNTGATTITGDIGTFPTTSETGFGTIVQTGVNHAGDAVTQQAKLDLVVAYNDAAGRGPATAVVPVDLAGEVLTPGVYSSGTIELSGALTLDAQGDPDAVFVFQAASTLITGSASTVNIINGGAGSACNVYWQVGSSATLGSGSSFVGTILASTSISLNSSAVVEGRLLAQTGAVTMINNTITNTGCSILPAATTTSTTSTTTAGPATTTPDAEAGGPPPTDATPPALAVTGTDLWISFMGVTILLTGVFFVGLSTNRRRPHRRSS